MEAIQKAIAKTKQAVKKSASVEARPVENKHSSSKNAQVNELLDSTINKSSSPAGEKFAPVEITYKQTRIIEVNQRDIFTNKVQAAASKNVVSDAFKMLRAQMLLQMREKNLKTLAVTGATEGVGKSLVAVNLAVSMSLETNQTIMLVDLDLKRPSIATYFGIEKQIDRGIGDYLLDDVPLHEIFINPGMERLVLLPGRKSYNNSPEIISSQKMFDLIHDLKSHYTSRIIIFDLPPILATPDAFSLMPHFDSSILVIEDGRNTRNELNASMKMMERTTFLGSVLNKGVVHQSSYY